MTLTTVSWITQHRPRNSMLLIQQLNPKAKTLLDVACDTGKYLENMRKYYQVEGLDILPDMLESARERCPETPFHQADMIDFYLGRKFDVVTCLFCSIGYVNTIENVDYLVGTPEGVTYFKEWEQMGLFTHEEYIHQSARKVWPGGVSF